jgi:hypothetical protein
MMDLNTVDDATFNNAIAKAGRLRQRREQLLAQIAAAEQQITDLENQAKLKFGDDYFVRFSDALVQVAAYEENL